MPTLIAVQKPSQANSSDNFSDPLPRDANVTGQLADYKALDPRWHDWSTVKSLLADLAERLAK